MFQKRIKPWIFWSVWESVPRTWSRAAGSSCSFKRYVGVSFASQHNLYAEFHTYLYSYVDTYIAGRTWLIWSYTGKECQVYPYLAEYEPWTIKVGSFHLAWYNSKTGEGIILVLHQDLKMEDQEPSLIYLNQLWANRITVNDVPRSLPGGDVKNPNSIYVPEGRYDTVEG